MRLLITGASGYVGTEICRLAISEGHDVTAIVRPGSDRSRLQALSGVSIAEVDPGDFASVRTAVDGAQPDATLHLASLVNANLAGPDVPNLIAANVTFGALLCEALADAGHGVLVNAASFWEYADGDGPLRNRPNSLYAATKTAFRDLVEHYVVNRGFRATNLVIYDIVGPGDWRGKLWNALAKAIVTDQPMGLTPGDQVMELVDVRDVAKGFLVAAAALHATPQACHQTFALDSGDRATLKEIVAQFGAVTGHPPRIKWGERAYPWFQVFEPVSSIPRLPGWRPAVDRAQSIADLAAEQA